MANSVQFFNSLVFRCAPQNVLVALGSLVVLATSAVAAPTPVHPAVSLTVFDAGGSLDAPTNGGYTLGGLEVDATGSVFVIGAGGNVGTPSTSLQLFQSTGLGTASPVGLPEPIQLNSRGFDLTENPADGNLYVVGTLFTAAPAPGIHGFDPAGVAPLSTFATTTGTWATSGLTFDAAGSTALVTTDGSGAATVNGLYRIPAGGPEALVVGSAPLPAGIGPTDDHVITLDGRTIVVGDGVHDIWDASGGAGSISLLIDLDVATPGPGMGLGGNRAAVDPVSGDIFVAWGLSAGTDIVRVKADGSGAARFAKGMPGERIRDLAFGPASSGDGQTNLYVSAAMLNGQGAIYELTTIPEPSAMAMIFLGATALMARRNRFS